MRSQVRIHRHRKSLRRTMISCRVRLLCFWKSLRKTMISCWDRFHHLWKSLRKTMISCRIRLHCSRKSLRKVRISSWVRLHSRRKSYREIMMISWVSAQRLCDLSHPCQRLTHFKFFFFGLGSMLDNFYKLGGKGINLSCWWWELNPCHRDKKENPVTIKQIHDSLKLYILTCVELF